MGGFNQVENQREEPGMFAGYSSGYRR